jgi:predicted protein tyrosine phosphatase
MPEKLRGCKNEFTKRDKILMEQRVNKLKIIKNPTKKSGMDLMNDLKKEGYEVSVEQIGPVIVRIDKKHVPMSLNGKKTKILFLCMMGRDRSPKACEIILRDFSNELEAKFAGVSEIADTFLTKHVIEWADKIICMERQHRDILFMRFPEAMEKEVLAWNISSDYSREDKELENELKEMIANLIN